MEEEKKKGVVKILSQRSEYQGNRKRKNPRYRGKSLELEIFKALLG